MYCKTMWVGGGGAAIIGANATKKICCDDSIAKTAHEHCDVINHGFVRDAFVAFPGHGPAFWILNIIAIIVGINTIIYAVLSIWKIRPRRRQPLIDPQYENNSPYGDGSVFNYHGTGASNLVPIGPFAFVGGSGTTVGVHATAAPPSSGPFSSGVLPAYIATTAYAPAPAPAP